MPCQNCSPNAIEFQCGDPPRLICVRSESDPIAIPAWVSPVCVAAELTGLALFSDEAGTIPLVGYTYADRVPCPPSLLGTSCEVPMQANLCPATMVPLLAAIDEAGEEIEAAIAAAATSIINAVQAGPIDPNYAYAYTYTANGDVQTVTRTTVVAGFHACEVQTYIYDVNNVLQSTTSWVACP